MGTYYASIHYAASCTQQHGLSCGRLRFGGSIRQPQIQNIYKVQDWLMARRK